MRNHKTTNRYEQKRESRIAKEFGEDYFPDDFSFAEKTIHAQARVQQRGITPEMEMLIQLFGEADLQKGGTDVLRIPTETLKKLRKAIDKLQNVSLIVNPEQNTLITAFHQDKKIRTIRNQ